MLEQSHLMGEIEMVKVPVMCPYAKQCSNYLKHCHHCTLNVLLEIGNYFVDKNNSAEGKLRYFDDVDEL